MKFGIDYIFFIFQNNLEFMVGILSFISVGSDIFYLAFLLLCICLVTRKIRQLFIYQACDNS